MSAAHDNIKSAQSIVSMAALILGGVWAYNEFVRERPQYPRAEVEIASVTPVELPGGLTLLRSDVVVSNAGSVAFTIDQALLKVERVLPLGSGCDDSTDDPSRCLADRGLAIPVDRERDAPRFEWPTIVYWKGPVGPLFLEPGETHLVDLEVTIPSDISVVRIYVHMNNKRLAEERPRIGWNTSTYFDLRSADDGTQDPQ